MINLYLYIVNEDLDYRKSLEDRQNLTLKQNRSRIKCRNNGPEIEEGAFVSSLVSMNIEWEWVRVEAGVCYHIEICEGN
jgi:hypothetical protein